MDEKTAVREMPKYRCHKEVWALKIKAIEPLFPPPCIHRYGQTTCGYGPNECMHIGTDSNVNPPTGRHQYVPGEKWTYGLAEAGVITPEDAGYTPFPVDAEYIRKHKPEVGGYFVQYEDGYKSFSPAKAFEDGYAKI